MHALAAPVLVIICLALCPAQGTGLAEEQEREEALSLGLPSYPEPQERDVPSNTLISYLLNLFSRTPQHPTDTQFSQHLDRDTSSSFRTQMVPKRLYYGPRLGKRDPPTLLEDSEARREKREAAPGEEEGREEENYGNFNWWWPLVTVRRSPFLPRPGKREDDVASDLYDTEDLQGNLEGYLGGELNQAQLAAAKREPGFAFSPRLGKRAGLAFGPRLGKKNFALVPRPGKKGDFAFSPRLGKRADFASVPRPGRRGDFAFIPRLGKKTDFAFSPRLGKKADFAFSPRLGKREVKA